MGPVNSKSFVNISNEIAASVIMRNLQNCSGGISQKQVMANKGSVFFTSQSQDASINLSCASNFKMNNDIASQIASEIKQKADASGVALLSVGGANASAETIIHNAVAVNITSELVQNTIANIQQEQLMANAGMTFAVSQNQSASLIQEAIATAINNTNFSSQIDSMVDNSAKSTSTNPLSFLADMMKWWVILILVIIVVIIGGLFYLLAS